MMKFNCAVTCLYLLLGALPELMGFPQLPQESQTEENSQKLEVAEFLPGISIFDAATESQRQNSKLPTEFELLLFPSVQQDLELVEEQVQKLQKLHSEYASSMGDAMQQLRGGTLSGKEYTELLVEQKARQQVELETLMLPEQKRRLQQVKVQTFLLQSGLSTGILNEHVSISLELTAQQKEQLKKLSTDFKKHFAETVTKMKEGHKKDILAVLSEKQRTRLADLIGDTLDVRKADFQQEK